MHSALRRMWLSINLGPLCRALPLAKIIGISETICVPESLVCVPSDFVPVIPFVSFAFCISLDRIRNMAQFHPNKEINDVIEHAILLGWSYTLSNGHAHGQLWCPRHARDGCRWSVWSTPRNPLKHARWLRRQIDSCPHKGE